MTGLSHKRGFAASQRMISKGGKWKFAANAKIKIDLQIAAVRIPAAPTPATRATRPASRWSSPPESRAPATSPSGRTREPRTCRTARAGPQAPDVRARGAARIGTAHCSSPRAAMTANGSGAMSVVIFRRRASTSFVSSPDSIALTPSATAALY